MSRLTRDGTVEPVSRDQILRRERGHGKHIFPVQLTTSRIGNITRLILTLAICDDHAAIQVHCCTKGFKVLEYIGAKAVYSTDSSSTSTELVVLKVHRYCRLDTILPGIILL